MNNVIMSVDAIENEVNNFFQEIQRSTAERMAWLNDNPDDFAAFKDQLDDLCEIDGYKLDDEFAAVRRHLLDMAQSMGDAHFGIGHFALYVAQVRSWPGAPYSEEVAREHLVRATQLGCTEAVDVLEDERIDAAFNAVFPDHASNPASYIDMRRLLRRVLANLQGTRIYPIEKIDARLIIEFNRYTPCFSGGYAVNNSENISALRRVLMSFLTAKPLASL